MGVGWAIMDLKPPTKSEILNPGIPWNPVEYPSSPWKWYKMNSPER